MNVLTTGDFTHHAPAFDSPGFHLRLTRFNHKRLRPEPDSSSWESNLAEEIRMRHLEGLYVEHLRAEIAPWMQGVPTAPAVFMDWFNDLRHDGPGQGDPLFPWLAEYADMKAMKWFLTQEAAGEAGFDDLVAMTQVQFPARPKVEMASNYWDEMGRGRLQAMHGLMLSQCVDALQLKPSMESTVWESLALGNLMVALAANRHYAYQSVGALGVIEMTAPGRVSRVNEGLKRLGVDAPGRRYFQIHAGLDIKHSEQWNREVIEPLITSDPALARPIAEGALLRLAAGARCFARYRGLLWGGEQKAVA